jgi:flagellum-specific peptidoglycan hydrolase FlgJ
LSATHLTASAASNDAAAPDLSNSAPLGAVAHAADAAQTVDAQTANAQAAEPTQVADMQTATIAPTATVAPTQVQSHLPAWVQVVVASGALYTADTSSDQLLTHLNRHTFLRVLSGGTSRLQVQAYDEAGTPGQTGWVSADQVLPSAPGTDWLVSASATTLWSDSATAIRNLDAFTPLQKLDGPQLNRLQVNVYASDFSKVVATGWVDVSATGPALAPQVRVPGPTDRALANRVATSSDQQMTFLNDAAVGARQAAAQTGVPASVTVAQAILESDWGRSTLAQNANNFFGMKVMGTLGNDGLVWMPTSEYDASGQLYQTTSAFRAYKSLADSIADHDQLLAKASRYAGAMKAASDPKQFASLIAEEGYSTDPAYADKLVALMDRYNLYQLDA